MARPRIIKHGNWWRVYVRGHLFYAGKRHADAWERAEAVATHARRHQFNRDADRIAASLHRMENR